MTLPIPKLDDRTFTELFEEVRNLIPRYAPEWTDHNMSDPGITLIELFTWLAEMQVFYLDRITDKNILKFLQLLGERPIPAQSAMADLTFTLSGSDKEPISLLKGAQFAATNPNTAERIVFELGENVMVTPLVLERLFSRHGRRQIEHTAVNNTTNLFYLPLGELPSPIDEFHLGLNSANDFPEGEIKLTVNVIDNDRSEGSPGGEPLSGHIIPSAELKWEYWNGRRWRALTITVDNTAALTRSGRIGFTGPGDIRKAAQPFADKALYWIRVRVKYANYELPPRIDTILLNTATVSHGETIRGEKAAATGLPFQVVTLKHKPVLAETVRVKVLEDDRKWHEWTEVKDFDASGPEDHHFQVMAAEGRVHFGDGIQGRVPPAIKENDEPVENILIEQYRAGGGEKGNVEANTITEILDLNFSPERIQLYHEEIVPLPQTHSVDKKRLLELEVTNRRAAVGGSEVESSEDAQTRVRRNLKKRHRSVNTGDFETLAKQTPGLRIARVQVLPQFYPELPAIPMPGAVTIVVVPEILPGPLERLPEPSPGFLQTVRQHLRSKTLLTTNLQVVGPEFIKVIVSARIKIDPRSGSESVRVESESKLHEFLDPLSGGIDGDGWPFGRPVFKSEIFQILKQITGVVCVEAVSISAMGCGPRTEDKIPIPKIGLVYSGQHKIIIE